MNQTKPTLIFDMDGVILDTEQLVRRCWNEIAPEFHADAIDAVFLTTVGTTRVHTCSILRERYGADFPAEEFNNAVSRRYHVIDDAEGVPVKTGARELLQWARDNAAASGLKEHPIRWLVDDCMKFVQREQRRGSRYDAIIMDPPSYGRGPGGEVWQLHEKIYGLIEDCAAILNRDASFFMVNSYTTGLSPSVMEYMLGSILIPSRGGRVWSDEIGLPVSASGLALPCGGTAVWQR